MTQVMGTRATGTGRMEGTRWEWGGCPSWASVHSPSSCSPSTRGSCAAATPSTATATVLVTLHPCTHALRRPSHPTLNFFKYAAEELVEMLRMECKHCKTECCCCCPCQAPLAISCPSFQATHCVTVSLGAVLIGEQSAVFQCWHSALIHRVLCCRFNNFVRGFWALQVRG